MIIVELNGGDDEGTDNNNNNNDGDNDDAEKCNTSVDYLRSFHVGTVICVDGN